MAESAKTNTLLPAYLIVGDDELKRKTALARLRKRVEAAGEADFNIDVFQGDSASGDDIVASCNTMPFLSDLRLVQVNSADSLKKADSEALVAYLQAPCETTVLALDADKLAKTTRLYKAIAALGKTAIVDCSAPKGYDVVKLVRSMAVGQGVTMNERAAQKLIELVGENTVRLDAEIRKLSLAHSGNDPISEREVVALVARTSEPKPWLMVDAFADRDVTSCLNILNKLDSVSPYQLIGSCTRRIRELIIVKCLVARGQGGMAAQALGEFNGRAMQSWQVKNHAKWAAKYSMKELKEALCSARETERRMKSGSDPDGAFLEWALQVMAKS